MSRELQELRVAADERLSGLAMTPSLEARILAACSVAPAEKPLWRKWAPALAGTLAAGLVFTITLMGYRTYLNTTQPKAQSEGQQADSVLAAQPEKNPEKKLPQRMEKDGKYGYQSEDGSVFVSPAFDRAFPFDPNVRLAKVGTEQNGVIWYGLIDEHGNAITHGSRSLGRSTEFPYLHISDFSEGFAVMQVENGLCGYLNDAGEVAIPASFRSLGRFKGGCARVLLNDKEQVIDVNGELVEVDPGVLESLPEFEKTVQVPQG